MERYVTTDGIMLYDVGCKDKHVSIWSYRSWKLDVYIFISCVTSGTGTANPSGAHELTPVLLDL